MKKALICGLLSVCYFLFAGNPAAAQEAKPYFAPEGSELRYETKDKKDKATGSRVAVIRRITAAGDIQNAETVQTFYDKKGRKDLQMVSKVYFRGGTTYFTIDFEDMVAKMENDADLAELRSMGVTMSIRPAELDIPFGVEPGTKLKDVESKVNFSMQIPFDMSIIIGDRTIEGYETVTTPAGEFVNCLKMSLVPKIRIGVIPQSMGKEIVWYAPGVGLVKSESYGGGKSPEETTLLMSLTLK